MRRSICKEYCRSAVVCDYLTKVDIFCDIWKMKEKGIRCSREHDIVCSPLTTATIIQMIIIFCLQFLLYITWFSSGSLNVRVLSHVNFTLYRIILILRDVITNFASHIEQVTSYTTDFKLCPTNWLIETFFLAFAKPYYFHNIWCNFCGLKITDRLYGFFKYLIFSI